MDTVRTLTEYFGNVLQKKITNTVCDIFTNALEKNVVV